MISREAYLAVTQEIIRGHIFASTQEMAEYIANAFYFMGECAEQYALDMEVEYVQNLINAR